MSKAIYKKNFAFTKQDLDRLKLAREAIGTHSDTEAIRVLLKRAEATE